MKIQFIDLKRQYDLYRCDIDKEIHEVLESCAFIMGPQIATMEERLKKYVSVPEAISCGSGTDALLLALLAYGVKPGDEIITTPFSFVATSEVIALLGAKPVFVDIQEETFNISPEKISSAITPKAKGIIAVDIFGQCADYDDILSIARDKGLFVIEDAAQSFGARSHNKMSCSFGDISCTSFFPAKPLGCYGDGGMVFTHNHALAEIMRSLRIHGKGTDKYDNVRIGVNARMDTIQAAVILAKFKNYEREIQLRQEVAGRYTTGLKGLVQTPVVQPHNLSVFAQYCILCPNRDGLQTHLQANGIPTAIHYPKPLHLQTAFSYLGYRSGDFPIAERTCAQIIALPMHPFLTSPEQEYIINTIKSFFRA